jgi:hypothetical protein
MSEGNNGDASPNSDDGGAETWTPAVIAQVVFHLFEDPSFFEKGIFGNGAGRANPLGALMKLVSFSIISVVNVLIIMSTAAVSMETVPEFSSDPHRNPEYYRDWEGTWNTLEILCVAAFTADLIVRLLGAAASGPAVARQFLTDWMNLVDVVAIAPFYLELLDWDGGLDLRFLRVVRLVRILKALPGAKNGDRIGLITEIITTSYEALLIPVFFSMLALVCLSSITYSIERTRYQICEMGDGTRVEGWVSTAKAIGYYDDSSGFYLGEQHPLYPQGLKQGYLYNTGCIDDYGCACPGTISFVDLSGTVWSSELFESIPAVFWWCIVTFTTVGYGDVNPRTSAGQQVAALTMFIGIFFLSMPISIVGDSFTRSWNRYTARRDQLEAEAERQTAAEEKKALMDAGKYEQTELGGPHDALNDDILGFFVKSKKKLKAMRPAEEDQGQTWDTALAMIESTNNSWMELYRELKSVA